MATPADAALMMQLGAQTVFVGSGIFKSNDPEERGRAIVDAVAYYDDPQKLIECSLELGEAMGSLDVRTMNDDERMATRGW